MARFLVQTIPNKLPELLINLSSQGPHLMGATLSTLLRAVHPGTIAMTDFRRRLSEAQGVWMSGCQVKSSSYSPHKYKIAPL